MVWGTVRERVEGRDGGPNGERDRERGKCALAVFNICSREGERGSERNREREREQATAASAQHSFSLNIQASKKYLWPLSD